MGKISCKGNDDQMIDIIPAYDLVLALLYRNEFQSFAIRMNDQPRMREKGYHYRFTAYFPGFLRHQTKDLLVPDVNAIECPDCNDGIGDRLEQIYVVVYLQEPGVS